jgi:hypothetical protein
VEYLNPRRGAQAGQSGRHLSVDGFGDTSKMWFKPVNLEEARFSTPPRMPLSPFACYEPRNWHSTLYPLSSQGAFLRTVSALLTRNFRRISEEDSADVRAVDLATNKS